VLGGVRRRRCRRSLVTGGAGLVMRQRLMVMVVMMMRRRRRRRCLHALTGAGQRRLRSHVTGSSQPDADRRGFHLLAHGGHLALEQFRHAADRVHKTDAFIAIERRLPERFHRHFASLRSRSSLWLRRDRRAKSRRSLRPSQSIVRAAHFCCYCTSGSRA